MNKFMIIPDITCDMSSEIREFFGLEVYMPGYVHINDTELRTTLDWTNISRTEFYTTLANTKNKVSSATASPEEYYQLFKKYAQEGYGIISMSLSSKISATYNVATIAVNRIKEEFPNIDAYSIDTCRMSGSFGLLVAYACDLRRQGKTCGEVAEWVEKNKCRVHQMGPIDDLTFVARRGQISKGKAFMGNLVGIKPMGDSNRDGYVTVLAKAKGMKKALDATVSYVERVATDIEEQYIFITHSDREKYANELCEKLEAKIKCKRIFVSDVFGGCGTNIGPGMVGVYFMGEPISEDVAVEKEILTKILSEN